jgi:hypothetical protein
MTKASSDLRQTSLNACPEASTLQLEVHLDQKFPNCATLLVLWGGVRVCVGDFILKEIWAQDKICILIGTLLG